MKKVFYIFLSIFSLLIINGKEYECEAKNDSFNEIEKYILNEYDFVESGIKLEYTVKTGIDDEIERIEEILMNKNNLIVTKGKNCIFAEDENINYSVTIYNYDGLIKVEVIIINKDKNISEKTLKLLVKEIRNDNFVDERYFLFIKGKINTTDINIFEDIEKKVQFKITDSLDISNGNIAKGTMRDGTNINIGQITYDTGSYLIIGTPIIFVTY